MEVALIDLQPKVKPVLREPTNLSGGVDTLVQPLLACVEKLVQVIGVTLHSIRGIGVSVPTW